MIRNTGPGKRLLAAGIVLILGMTGCGTDNELSLTGTEETGIEVMATVDFTEEAATGENAPDVTDGDAATGAAYSIFLRKNMKSAAGFRVDSVLNEFSHSCYFT